MHPLAIHWFRSDLRIQDHPALSYASRLKLPLVTLYILENEEPTTQDIWLQASLQALSASLQKLNIPLEVASGAPLDVWTHLLEKYPIQAVSWSTCFEPAGMKRDAQIEKLLSKHGIAVHKENGTHLLGPDELKTQSGDFYKVFTPYYRKHQTLYFPPKAAPAVRANTTLPSFKITSKHSSGTNQPFSLGKEWEPGEKGAQKKVRHFISGFLSHYGKARDYPAQNGTSKLSPHLHFGEISPHTVVRLCKNPSFIRELVFRDFAMQLLYHIPDLPSQPMRREFSKWKWDNNAALFNAWKKGNTGYPIVDAGMRELFETGFMHNRSRMIVASFLVKDLNIAWQKGALWFLSRLYDADLAVNSFNWQWCAGTGPDAQPFFRIFNPELQSTKFDPEGAYIRKWVPELKKMPSKFIHAPWKAPASVLTAAGVTLGDTYPCPIIDHDAAKKATLQQFRRLSG